MKEKDFMIGVQPHQLARGGDHLVHDVLEKGRTMPDLEDRQPGIIKVQDGVTGLFEDFFRQDAWTGVEIVNHGALLLI